MTLTRQEEIIACLWIIAAMMAFRNDFTIWGWVFVIKGCLDLVCSVWRGLRERRNKAKTPREKIRLYGPEKREADV